jgi:ribosomal protein S24E
MENFKILEQKENPLFKRKEVITELHAKVIPSKTEVEKLVSDKFSVNPESLKIKKIEGKFGSRKFKIFVNIYESKKDKDSTEVKPKKQREAEKKAAAEALKTKKSESKPKTE